MIGTTSTSARSPWRTWPSLLVVAAAVIGLVSVVAADGSEPDPADASTTTEEDLTRQLVNEGHIPGGPRDDDVADVTRRLVNEGQIPRGAR